LQVDSLNYAFEYGELFNSQKQATITSIEKKAGKDKRLIKNWRPISVYNVDVKIASKALARRLERPFLRLFTSIRVRLLKEGR